MPAQATATQPPDLTETTPRSRRPSSRVGKRKVLLSGIDTHARSYLEFRDVVADLANHLGTPTVVQWAIIEETAGLICWCRSARRALLKGEEFNVGTYTTATNTLRRLLADIGQEALLRDVTPPSLAELADTIEREGALSTVENAPPNGNAYSPGELATPNANGSMKPHPSDGREVVTAVERSAGGTLTPQSDDNAPETEPEVVGT